MSIYLQAGSEGVKGEGGGCLYDSRCVCVSVCVVLFACVGVYLGSKQIIFLESLTGFSGPGGFPCLPSDWHV